MPESEMNENQVYVSNTDQLMVVFTSVEHYRSKGFQASYYTGNIFTSTVVACNEMTHLIIV